MNQIALSRRATYAFGWTGVPRGLLAVLRPIASLVLGAGLLGAAALAVEHHVTHMLLAELTARAVDQATLAVLDRVDAAALTPPLDADRLAEIDADLAPRLQLLRRPDSDIARINVYARDGTLISGDRPDRRGERVTADDAPLLAQALQGSVVAERTRLDQAENADLKPSLGEALEVYVPLVVDGQVVGAYEVYADLGPVLWLRSVLWALIVTFVVVCGVGIVLVQRGRARGLAAGSSERVFGHARRGPALGAPSGAAPEASILSRREREVLCLLASTHSYREIAETLVLSEETVRTHVKNILRKLEQPNRTQAVIAAIQLGLLTLDPPPVRRAERPQ